MALAREEEIAWLSELEALEQHRMRYLSRFPDAPLQHDDPDIRRMIEALALFAIRTRRIARRNAEDAIGRLFRQHFEGLLDPTPTMVRVRADPGPNFADIVDVPRGTELLLTKSVKLQNGVPERLAITMTTLESVRVLPLEVQRIYLDSAERTELVVNLVSKHRRSAIKLHAVDDDGDLTGEIVFEIDQLGEFAPSAAVLEMLRDNVSHVWVEYEAAGASSGTHEMLEATPLHQALRFGAGEPHQTELLPLDRPLQRLRAFFHNPWTELRMTVRLPVPRQRQTWQRIRLRFELRRPWPRHLGLQPSMLTLNRVPAVNLKRDWASPIVCDGTRDRYPILHPLPATRFQPHSILGVFEYTPSGPMPLLPSSVQPKGKSYEIEVEGEGVDRRLWLHVDAPGAFDEPVTIGVEALWYQPVSRHLGGDHVDVRMANAFVSSLEWAATPTIPGSQVLRGGEVESMMQMLSLKYQTTLTRNELVFLLETLGAGQHRELRRILDALCEVRRREEPYAKGVAGLKTVYTVALRELDASMIPMVRLVAPRLREFLSIWSRDDVELEVELAEYPEHSLSQRDVRDYAMPVVARMRGES